MKIYNEAHLNILTTTKDVYINQINNYIKNFMCEGFLSIYEESYKTNRLDVNTTFKKNLSNISRWDDDILANEYKRFSDKNDEKKFERLIRAIFLTYTKILSSVKIDMNKESQITLIIPNG